MVSAPKVVEDGRETVTRRRDGARWGWLGAGILIGLGLSVLLPGSETGAPSEQLTLPTTTTVAEGPGLGGIGDVVEGFPDTLVGAMRSDGISLELAIWPVAGDLYERSVTVGAASPPPPVAFDPSGRLLATVIPTRDEGYGVLYAGVPDTATILALDATGYAWHDSTPVRLAYTTFEDGETLLWVTSGNLAESELVSRTVGIEGGVVAWGDWGFALQDESSVVLLTPTGEIKDSHPGRALASYRTGWLAVDNEGIGLLSAGGGVRGLDREGLRGDALTAAFSPNGEFLALITRDGALIVTVDEEFGLIDAGGDTGVPQVVWSSDSRFALYPGRRGIMVVDTEDFGFQEILSTRTFTGLGVVP